MEERKQREAHFHDQLRGELLSTGDPKYTSYRKWYLAGYQGREWLDGWLRRHATGKVVLDYGCGSGDFSITIAKMGCKQVVGIDISSRSVEMAREKAEQAGVDIDFRVMDAEDTEFGPGTFDIIVCAGVLHHMDLKHAYPEIARILKSNGTVVALEALGHNPLINWYRHRTPYLRSPDEHPLHFQDLDLAKRFFADVKVHYFSLATLAAAPLWKTPSLVRSISKLLSPIDFVLLRIPIIQRQAWMGGCPRSS